MNTKTKNLLYLLCLCLTPLQAADDISSSHSSIQISPDTQDKKENSHDDNLQNDSSPHQLVDDFEMTQYIQQTKSDFNEFLEQYAHSFTETIRSSFKLFNNYSLSDVKKIPEAVENLTNCLDTLQAISIRTPKLLKKLFGNDELLETAQDKLKRLCKDIDLKASQQKKDKSSSLHHTLQVVKHLTTFDDYLPPKSQLTFSEIYQTNSQVFYSKVIELSEVENNMEKEKYKEVAQSMEKLLQITQLSSNDMKVKKELEAIRRTIDQYLKKRIRRVKIKIILLSQSEVEKNTIIKLKDELTILDEAMEAFCFNNCDLLDKKRREKLLKQKKLVYQELTVWPKELITKIETLIDSFDFLSAEKHIEELKEINKILGENMIKTYGSDNPYKEINEKIRKVENKLQKKLEDQEEYYMAITLDGKKHNPYTEHPPGKFCQKLTEASNKQDDKYQETFNRIKADICEKVKNLIKKGEENPLQSEEIFDLCEDVLTSLPKKWFNGVEERIKKKRKKVGDLKRGESQRIEQILERGSMGEKCKLLKDLKSSKDITNASSRVEMSILRESDTKYKKIQEYVQEGNIKKTYDVLEELYQNQRHYAKLCPFIQTNYKDACTYLSDELKSKANFLKQNLSSPNQESKKSNVALMKTYLEQIRQFNETFLAKRKN